MNNSERWLNWARRIQSIAQIGLEYAHNEYDVERNEKLIEIASEIMEHHTGESKNDIQKIYFNQKGYSTPKVDVRAAVVEDGKILLVKEKSDGKWALPGGWMDVGDTPAEAAVRETFEESGFNVEVKKIVGVYDANRASGPLELFHAVKIVYLCKLIDGEATPSFETTEVKFFPFDKLPVLSQNRTNQKHISDIKIHIEKSGSPTVFD